jgi:protein-L-isoaspartate(D-aspartate) O-methyltransferase
MNDFTRIRDRMVEEQLVARGICHPGVLQAMREVPRHRFVDEGLSASAYGDHALPLGYGQTISQPYMVAIMTEALDPKPEHRVLEIGTGSGYQAAVLARLVRTVFTIERIPQLTVRAQRLLEELGIENVVLTTGDGTIGWKRFAPFDGIVVTAGGPQPPASLIQQLASGGRLVCPTGSRDLQQLAVVTKGAGEEFSTRWGISCNFVPLLGREGWREPREEPLA